MSRTSKRQTDLALTRRNMVFGVALGATALAGQVVYGNPVKAQPTGTGTVLITGANRGIGLELARTYATNGWKVIATARRPDEADDLKAIAVEHPQLSIEQLDVQDHAMIDALAEKLEGQPIDVLLNNAAILGGRENQEYPKLNFDMFEPVMTTNVEGPVKMCEAFLEHVAMSDQKKLIAITSRQGSIGSLFESSLIFYKSSKSALNMAMSVVAMRVADRGITVGLISPGAVDTRMMKNLGVIIPLITPAESARLVSGVIDGLTFEQSGIFISHTSKELPW